MVAKRYSLFRQARSLDVFRRLAIIAVLTNAIYIGWIAFHLIGPWSWLFFIFEFLVFLITILQAINHWSRQYELVGGGYSLRTPVDVFIPTVNEPIKMLANTIKAASEINHPAKTVYVLDDGDRKEVKQLALKYGCEYLVRPDRAEKRFKAANLNYGLKHSYGSYILTIDADNVVKPEILDDLLGHFAKPKTAFVASRQTFTVPNGDFNHDHLFYEHIQAGKNRDNAAISCGSGVVYSRKVLKAIGGFSEWNLVEDLHTSYIANSKGYRSVYVTQPYTLGHAPTDLSQVYKQRGTWALDTLRIFFWQNPLLQKGLTWRQKLHYFEMCYAYLVSAYFITGIYLINFYSLFTDEVILSGGWWYVVFRLPAMIASLWLFGRMSRGQLTWRIWAGLFPVYAIAGVKALFYRKKKPQYIVTSKVDHGKPEVRLVIPQLLMSFIGVFGLIYHIIVFGINLMFIFNFFWIGVMLYWLWPVISIGLKFKDIRVWTRKYSLQKTKRLSATS